MAPHDAATTNRRRHCQTATVPVAQVEISTGLAAYPAGRARCRGAFGASHSMIYAGGRRITATLRRAGVNRPVPLPLLRRLRRRRSQDVAASVSASKANLVVQRFITFISVDGCRRAAALWCGINCRRQQGTLYRGNDDDLWTLQTRSRGHRAEVVNVRALLPDLPLPISTTRILRRQRLDAAPLVVAVSYDLVASSLLATLRTNTFRLAIRSEHRASRNTRSRWRLRLSCTIRSDRLAARRQMRATPIGLRHRKHPAPPVGPRKEIAALYNPDLTASNSGRRGAYRPRRIAAISNAGPRASASNWLRLPTRRSSAATGAESRTTHWAMCRRPRPACACPASLAIGAPDLDRLWTSRSRWLASANRQWQALGPLRRARHSPEGDAVCERNYSGYRRALLLIRPDRRLASRGLAL